MQPTEQFTRLVRRPDHEIPLDEAALLIAAHDHDVDIPSTLASLDNLARSAPDEPDALAEFLFADGRFTGNEVDYADPRNSFLDEVLRRHLGIPITLSVLMIEVSRRRGRRLEGIGMPGHFLVGAGPDQFIDPFHGGAVVDAAACRALFEQLRTGAPWTDAYLAPVGPRAILVRMLANLVHTLVERSPADAVWALRLRLAVPGVAAGERRDAAALLGTLGRFEEAATVLDDLATELDEPGAARARQDAARLRPRALNPGPSHVPPTPGPLPMFPLGTVLFPHGVLPLHVFEPRYRALTEHCLANDARFGVVLIERGSEVGGGDHRCAVGTAARIVQAGRVEDGRWVLVTVGEHRVRVSQWLPDDPYPIAAVEVLDEQGGPDAVALLPDVSRALQRMLALRTELGEPGPGVDVALADDPVRASFEACALAGLGPFDAQQLLEMDDTVERLTRLRALLDEETAVLQLRLAEG